MKLETYVFKNDWDHPFDHTLNTKKTLIIVFGSSKIDHIRSPLQELTNFFSEASIIGASSAGEIIQDELYDNSLVAAVIQFSTTNICLINEPLTDMNDANVIGKKIAE